jgi:DnaJ family protein C protein 1
LEADGEQTPINATAATPPSLRSTWFIALLAALLDKMLGRETQPNVGIPADADSDDAEIETPDQERNHNIKSVKIGAAPAQKAGGRRRKATRK